MNREEKFLDTKHFRVEGKSGSSTGSSDYTTCSDNPNENLTIKKGNLFGSLQSVILAEQILPSHQRETTSGESLVFHCPNTDINNESNYSVSVLDQNLDALIDNNISMDHKDLSQSDLNVNDSTKYLQLESMSKLLEMKSSNYFYNNYSNLNKLDREGETNKLSDSLLDPIKSQTENERLITIMEETEVTHATSSFLKNQSLINLETNNRDSTLEMVDECKSYDRISNYNKNSKRRVLFANKSDKKYNKPDKLKFKKPEKCLNIQISEDRCCAQKRRDINKNYNTTESFVLWEKLCKTSDKLVSRRSHSFSELSSVTESYIGDDEYSTSFKTLDETYLSDISLDTNDKDISQKKYSKSKSKSCDSLLKEVKHLPHILYDRFLKCLAKEIENIRKQNVVCTCHKLDQHSNKENNGRSLKYNAKSPVIQISNGKNIEKTLLKNSPVKTIPNQNKLSPEILKSLPQDIQRLSPKSLNKTPTTPSKKRGLYSWQKEIVSPVGEYIRGKRQSPFKTSPNKKKS